MLKPRIRLGAVVGEVPLSDADLIGRFIADGDEAAFAAVVRRHRPTVFGVCRKVLGNSPDADDAFQATFLVLVRKARRVAFRHDVSAWLVAVATRASLDLLRRRTRRAARETTGVEFDAPAPDAPSSAEACRVLLGEVAKLPEAYRSAVVLCELTGLSRAAAARRLGVSEGTLSSRLAAARRKLAARLTARGLAATLPILALPVPSALAAGVVDLASTSVIPSTAVTSLTEAMMRTSVVSVRTLAGIGVLVLATVGLSFGDEPTKPSAADSKPAAVATKPETTVGRDCIYYCRDDRLYSLGSDGKKEQRLSLSVGILTGTEPYLTAQPSPDGQLLAYWETFAGQSLMSVSDRAGKPVAERAAIPKHLGYRRFCWSPDGTQLHVSQSSWKTPGAVEHYTVDVKTRKVTPNEILRDHIVTDWSRDGKSYLTTRVGDGGPWRPKSVHLMKPDGTESKRLLVTDGWCAAMTLSPDGSRALCVLDGKLAVLDATAANPPVLVEGVPDGAEVTGAAWSPDGKRIAYCLGTTQFLNRADLRELESQLVVADPDGRNVKVLRAVKGESFGSVYWR